MVDANFKRAFSVGWAYNAHLELIALLTLALMTVMSVPEAAAPALLSQIIQVIGDNTWPAVVLALGLALIQTLGPKR